MATLPDTQAFIAVTSSSYVDGACFTESADAVDWVKKMERAGMVVRRIDRREAKRLLFTHLSADEQTQAGVNQHCVRNTPYKGYVSTWCGDGAVVFRSPDGSEVKGVGNAGDEWLSIAWLQAKSEIDRLTA